MTQKQPGKNLWLAFLLALSIPILVWAYAEGPPDAHTGGFGEPTCNECHGTRVNSNGGNVTINGLPSGGYTSGNTYPITVTITDSTARRWGFELSARTSDGKQAGTLAKGGDGFTQIAAAFANPSVQYIEHTIQGTRPGTSGPQSFTFNWTAPDASRGTVVFDVAANAANNNSVNDAGDHIYQTEVKLQPQAITTGPAPSVNDNGTVNNASFAPGTTALAPGTIAAIFGSDLNDGSQNQFNSFGSDGKLQTALGGATVTLNGIAAPIFNSFPGQITVEIPVELAGQTSAQVVVTAGGQSSTPKTVSIGSFSPGIFTVNNQGTGQGIVQLANTITFAAQANSIPGVASQPVARGGFITIYATGLGAVNNPPGTGQPAVDGSSTTTTTPQVSVGGVPAQVTFSGLSPGFVGLYQVNVQIPQAAPTGDAVPVTLSIGGVPANTVTIAVQ